MRALLLAAILGSVLVGCPILSEAKSGVSSSQTHPLTTRQSNNQVKTHWRSATPSELEAALPARAQVEKERIETEMRTATGIVDDHNKIIAAVVLITAGYAANGKYSHYLLVQSPITLADTLHLPPGSYVLGWTRNEEGLLVHCFEAATGTERGAVTAHIPQPPLRVEPFRIRPPSEGSFIQIGRFIVPYKLEP